MDRGIALRIFESMIRIRRFEEAMIKLFDEGAYRGHTHVYIGQEGIGAPIIDLLEDADLVFSTHRNHGHYIACGGDPGRGLAEILGRRDGVHGGRTGSAHLSSAENGMLWSTGLVGGSLGMAIGGAWPLKVAGKGVSVAFFGDGALEEGIAYEALNVASLEKLPVLFICENNSIGAVGMSAGEWPSSTLNARLLTDVPASLSIESCQIDGSDAFQVYEAASAAIEKLRRGGGPVFIECQTTRWPGSRYARTRLVTGETNIAAAWASETVNGEHADWVCRADPVIVFARGIVERDLASRSELLDIDAATLETMKSARAFALACAFPAKETVFTHTFSGHDGVPA